jgi:uncharacterized protein YyaL (SSP411 family)
MSSTHKQPNHLISERSPYLQQHAYNPVEWFPWGDEAFQRARAENKPIFLSIGYSTCHWCHVMERESFEDENVAAFLREHFISIKVDREERPDVDAIYMAAVQAMSGQGGWPMTVFLTPQLDPFFGSTYFPPQPNYGRPSFMQLITKISEMWRDDNQSLIESSQALTAAIKANSKSGSGAELLSKELVDRCYQFFYQSYDPYEGGWGNAPKFPRPVQFEFLFNYYFNYKEEYAKEMALFTLRKMANGGMRDQLAGGFHRYSVDMHWRVPHFEKMLYDNAQLIHAYLDAYQITHDTFYADVASDTVDYVLREMTSPEGGFYSAEDADSEGEEGTFYVWTSQQIRDMLDPFDAKLALYYYGFMPQGNFEHGKNVLHVSHSVAEAAEAFEVGEEEIKESLKRSRKKLHDARASRPRPHRDDKILTSWNGLMIGAVARTGAVLGLQDYIEAAEKGAKFIWRTLRTEGQLMHRYRDGETKFSGYLETYAFLIQGFIHLYYATFNVAWIERAIELQEEQDQKLWDNDSGAYFMSQEASDLVVRTKNEYDGAEPSGNSVAANNLLELASLTGDDRFADRADTTVNSLLASVQQYPFAMPLLMVAGQRILQGSKEIVLSNEKLNDLSRHIEVMRARFMPGVAVLVNAKDSEPLSEFAKSQVAIGDLPTAYVCKEKTCELPTTDVKIFQQLLDKL